MAEKTKAKKLRIYKFASEYNLATETLVEFLTKKGHKVKNHMSLLNDDMLADISDHFKKDIESAEKHYRKISEFQKKLSEKEADEKDTESIEAEEPVKEVASGKEEEPAAEKPEEEVEETAEEETISEQHEPAESPETEEEPEVEAVEEAQESEEQTPEAKEAEEEPVEEEPQSDEEAFQTEGEKQLAATKKGLTIVGKIDIQDSKPRKRGRKAKAEKAPAEKSAETPKIEESDEEAKRKKKKKLRAKKKHRKEDEQDSPTAKKKRRVKKFEVDKKEVEAAIKRTLLSMDETSSGDRVSFRKKKKKERAEFMEIMEEQREHELHTLKVTEFVSVQELANLMQVNVSEVIQKCFDLGLMVSINQRLEKDTILLIADDFGFEVEFEDKFTSDVLEDTEDPEESLKPRAPVVTIMGHVDHGKTSLLDHIRQSNVVSGESGGITQHIGAYKVEMQDGRKIAFLDTPGHEAFTAMRARGAKVTDIVVLIVAADDAVMPQTVEAINHAQAAEVPIVVAINKIDKPNANPEKIKQQLADRNILIEEWGGKYQAAEISAKQGLNIDSLLDKILLEAELLDLKANPDRMARGTVIEAQLDKGRGITATILVQKGTLRIGDPFVAGNTYGRVRAMFDERNQKVVEAGPSTPVLVLGFEGTPQAGDDFIIVAGEREAREIGLKRQQLKRKQDHKQVHHITLDEIANQISQGGVKELPIVVKGDVDGSVEALSDSLMKLSTDEVKVAVIHKGVGAISESDVLLASASGAIIVGFHVRPHTNARKLAETEKVDIRLYNVIYDTINEVKSALEGMLSPVISEELVATVEVRDTFKVPKVGTVAGCYVVDGKIQRSNKIRLFRDGVVVYEGELATLKRFKDDVKEVDQGYECGLNINNFNDIKVGDIIEAYKIVETKKKLDD